MKKNFIVFGKPKISEDEIAEVVDTLRSGWIGTGPKAQQFEQLFCQYTGAKHSVSLNSCTAGLHLGLVVAEIGANAEVITTPMTFAATANVICHVNAKPVFVDCDKKTYNIDAAQIEKAITKKTRAIIPVHLAGYPCDMDPILEIAEKHGLVVIEDAAHALETTYKKKKIGAISHLTAFSFYATKTITTGEGGMLTTSNEEWANKLRILRLHGMDKDAWKRYQTTWSNPYDVIWPGYKYNLTDIAAAIGIHQLKKAEKFHKRREMIWKRYNEAFEQLPVLLPPEPEKGSQHARHLYAPLLELEKLNADREQVRRELFEEGIGTGIHFISLHLQKYYQERFGFKQTAFPNAAFVSERTLSLPLSPHLTTEEVERIIEAFQKVLSRHLKQPAARKQ